MRAVVRAGINGFDLGVWSGHDNQYLGDLARMPGVPNMSGYAVAAGPDIDGDGVPEVWVADPAAREFISGRGCVYVYSWKEHAPIMRLRGPSTDTLGTDLRIVAVGQTWRVEVASHVQDIFGHVYQRWNTFGLDGQLISTEHPSAATLVLKSGDIDKNMSTDAADIAAVYLKAALLMDDLGISGQKHAEDLDGDDLVDAADILQVLASVGVPEPNASALTDSMFYSVAPQRGLYNCYRCNWPCCYTGHCFCIEFRTPQTNVKPTVLGTNPGWWNGGPTNPGPTLPPGVYPDRRPQPTNQPHEDCDGFRVLPGDIEHGGILLPAVSLSNVISVTATIGDPSKAQFCANAQGEPMPRVRGGDIELRSTLNQAQIDRARGQIRLYGLDPGETEITVEVVMSGANGPETLTLTQPVKVGGRIEARLQRVRRWQPPASWQAAQRTAYQQAAAADSALRLPDYVAGLPPRLPTSEPMLGVEGGRIGMNPDLKGQASEGEGVDKVIVWDACDEKVSRPAKFFTKRLFLGDDSDGDGVSDPVDGMTGTAAMESLTVNHARINWAIDKRFGPFSGKRITQHDYRAETNPGTEIVAVVVGHAADRIGFDVGRSPQEPADSPMRRYYYPQVFGALDLIQPAGGGPQPGQPFPQFQEGAPEFKRWHTLGDVGGTRYTPTSHTFNGLSVKFGRPFAAGQAPTFEGAVQRQSITGATFIVPIMNANLYEALEKNFNRRELAGRLTLYDPNNPAGGAGVRVDAYFERWSVFGEPDFNDPAQHANRLIALGWLINAAGRSEVEAYRVANELPRVQFNLPSSMMEMDERALEDEDEESWWTTSIFWAETVTGFVPGADIVWGGYHGLMQVTGLDGEDHTIDLVMCGVGLAADLGYVGAAAGVVTNGTVAVVRIAIRHIGKIDDGRTLRLLFSHGDDAIKAAKRWVRYCGKHGRVEIERIVEAIALGLPSAEIQARLMAMVGVSASKVIDTYKRIATSRAATLLGNAVDSTGLPALAKTYEEGIQTLNKSVLDRVARKMIPAEGAEGWYLMARLRGVPELDDVVVKLRGSLDLGDELAQEAADEGMARFGKSVLKAVNDRYANEAGMVLDPRGLERVKDAMEAVNRGVVPGRFQALFDANVGVGKPFATNEELIAAVRMSGRNIEPLQRAAINNMRNLIPVPGRVAKVMPLRQGNPFLTNPDGGSFADDMLQQGQSSLSGSIADAVDVSGLNGIAAVNDALRLDYAGSPFVSGGPYAVIETSSPAVRGNAAVPRGHGYVTGAGNEFVTGQPYPRTGSAFTASRDGKLNPEWSVPSTQMAGGVDELGSPVTVMRMRHGDGTPYLHTRTVNGQAVTASDWKLMEPAPGVFVWEPL